MLFSAYSFLIFNVVNPEQNFMHGYVLIGITLLYMIYNFFRLIIDVILTSKAKLRLKYIKRKYKIDREKL